jgi:hypothetical protein
MPAAKPTSICLDCRTALPRGAACDGGPEHRVVDLERQDGRQDYLREVWGPASRQRRLRAIARASLVGSGVGALAQALECGSLDLGALTAALALVLIGALLFGAVSYVAGKIGDAARRRRFLRPYGALYRPRLPPAADVIIGIAEGKPLRSPLRGEPCLAFDIVLRSKYPGALGSNVLYREAGSDGLSVRLDTGEAVQIPAGRIRLVSSPGRPSAAARDRVLAHLPAGLGIAIEGELSDLPFDEAVEEVIRPGDRLAILSPVAQRELRDGPPESLRAPARLHAAAAIGLPVLRYAGDG